MIVIKRVLVATDFSPLAESALNYGRALARQFDGTLHVLTVVDDLTTRMEFTAAAAAGWAPAELQADVEHAAQEDLDAAVREDDRRELHAVTALRVDHHPARAICDYAREVGADVLVIGATGRGALDRMLTGSVADKVIRRAPCPVLTVRGLEREFVVPDMLQRVEVAGA